MPTKASRLALLYFLVGNSAFASSNTKRVLLSGFEPFGERIENSSQVAVETIVANLRANPDPAIPAEVESIVVPVAYDIAPQELLRKMDSYRPDIVISFGEAPDREFRLEAQARNLDDAPYADNRGVERRNEAIVVGAPEFLPTLLPIEEFQQDLAAAGIPTILSDSAGAYLCNHIFYHSMYAVSSEPAFQNIRAGFIHVPAESIENDPNYPQRYAFAIQLMLRRLLAK